MSTHDADNYFWKKLARKARTPRAPTSEEAERLFQTAPDEPMSDDEVAEISRAILTGTVVPKNVEKEPELSWLEQEEQRYLRDGVRQMNRNRRDDTDEDAEATLDELRRDLLDDDDDAEPSDKPG